MKIYKLEVFICDLNEDGMSSPQVLEEVLDDHLFLCGEVGKIITKEISYQQYDEGINSMTKDTLKEYNKIFKE